MSEPSKLRRILAKVYKLVKTTWGKILIVFTSFPFLRYVYNLIDAWGNFRMVTDGFPSIWRWIVWGWSYVNTTAGSMVVSAIGIGLIALQLNRQERRSLAKSKPTALETRPEESPSASETTQPALLEPEHKLTFEIAENESEIRLGGGTQVRRIEARMKLRCNKQTNSDIGVRDFHASLHKTNDDASETVVVAKENYRRVLDAKTMQPVPMDNGWMVSQIQTDYRYFLFFLEITPTLQATLSGSYFLRVSMDAVGQPPFIEDVRVNSWRDAEAGTSLVTLRRNYQRTDEIERRDEEISGLKTRVSQLEHETSNKEKRIDALIEQNGIVDKKLKEAESKNHKWEGVISDAEKQETAIEKHVKLTEVTLGDVTLTGYDPTVRFGIYVTNRSRLNISLAHDLESQIKGTIDFDGYKSISLRGTKTVLCEAKNIAPGQSGCLTIEQRLIDNEAKVIADGQGWPPATFDLSDLTINIVGAEPTSDITPADLEMQNATVTAFTVNLLERGKRIRAVAEVRGSAVQLQQVLTVIDEPLPKEVLERWESASRTALTKVYDEAALARVWERITDETPIPSIASLQRGWLTTRIVNSGAFLADLTGEYINRKTINRLTE